MGKPELIKTVFDWDHFAIYLSGSIDFSVDGGVGWRDVWSEKLIASGFKQHQIFNPCRKPLKGAAFNLDDESAIMKKHRDRREWSELVGVMSQIVHIDLRLVDKADIILVNMPKLSQEHFKATTETFSEAYEEIADAIRQLTMERKMGEDSAHYKSGMSALAKMRDSYMKLLAQASDMHTPTYGTLHEMVVAHQQRKPTFLVWEGGKETCSAWLMWMVGKDHVFGTFDELLTRLLNMSKGKAACNAKEWLWLDLDLS